MGLSGSNSGKVMSVTHLVRTQLEAFKSTANTAVTIGVLDGVHLGHQALLKCLYDEALSLIHI